MSKLLTKARAGVTLVELLVVILIVTILSVSMLPLLQPFVTEAQYAAEAIPVIGNLRTKIGLYQYDKGRLPESGTNGVELVQTWMVDPTSNDPDIFVPASYPLANNGGQTVSPFEGIATHIQRMVDVDYQDLKGKRSKPTHYQYCSISSISNIAYVVSCFGDGQGLKAGTGYAVCELNYPSLGKKYIGTWKCYKPVDENNGAIQFVTDMGAAIDTTTGRPVACYIPTKALYDADLTITAGEEPAQVSNMKSAGWEF